MATVDRDADVRLAVYEQTLDLIAARPMSGYGGGTYEDAFRAVKSDPISPDVTFDAAHNLYLELAAELGIPATIAVVLSVLLLAGTTAVAAVRRENWDDSGRRRQPSCSPVASTRWSISACRFRPSS